jgi:phage baseplate assembly protein W
MKRIHCFPPDGVRDHQDSTRPQDPDHLAQASSAALKMWEGRVADDAVKVGIRERKTVRVSFEQSHVGGEHLSPSNLEHPR